MQNGFETIPQFFRFYEKTAFEKDVAGMIHLYADTVVIFDMWETGFTLGLPDWSAIITEWLTSLDDEKVKVTFEMVDIEEDGNVGFASAIIRFQAIATDGSVQRSMKNRISLGFVKTDGLWKVKHQHTSAPIDSTLKAILDI